MEPSDSDEQWDDWSELWEYIRLSGQTTGLGYDIHVDNNKAYQTYGHELWLYVSCDGIKIPVTIEDHPKVKCVVDEDKYDFSRVFDFIRINKGLLINLANSKTNEHIFFRLLKRVDDGTKLDDSSLNEDDLSLATTYNHLEANALIELKDMDKSRTEVINNAIYQFRGGMAREFYFTNKDYSSVPYYYDPYDDSLHAENVSVPFHYKEWEITYSVIRNSLILLKEKLKEDYKKRGIMLYEYD